MENGTIQNKKREESIDIARGIAILMVAFYHLYSGEFLKSISSSFLMPFFFMVNGYFSKDYKVFSQEHKSFIIKTAKKLIIPYYTTCLLIILFTILFDILKKDFNAIYPHFVELGVSSLYALGVGPIFGINYIGAIWFLWAMFFASVIFSFFSKSKFSFLYSLILFFVGYYTSNKIIFLPLNIQTGLTNIIFIWAGRELKKLNANNILSEEKFYLSAIAAGIWGLMFKLDGSVVLAAGNGYSFIPANITSGVFGSITLLYLCIFIEKIIPNEKILTFFGKHSLIILCIHLLDLKTNIFHWPIADLVLKISNNTKISELILFTYKIIVYFIATYIIVKTPAGKLFGVHSKNKNTSV